jgi:hypothetical protein
VRCTAYSPAGSLVKNEAHTILRSMAISLGWRVLERTEQSKTFTIYDPGTMLCVSLKSFDKATGSLDSWFWMMVGELKNLKATCQVHLGDHPYFTLPMIRDAAEKLLPLLPLMAPFLSDAKISAKLNGDALMLTSGTATKNGNLMVRRARVLIDEQGPLYEIEGNKTRSERLAYEAFKLVGALKNGDVRV